jgi:hypothetical protein
MELRNRSRVLFVREHSLESALEENGTQIGPERTNLLNSARAREETQSEAVRIQNKTLSYNDLFSNSWDHAAQHLPTSVGASLQGGDEKANERGSETRRKHVCLQQSRASRLRSPLHVPFR